MRMILPTAVAACLLAGAAACLIAVPAGAGTLRRTCPKTVAVDGTPTRIVILRSTTCAQARGVLRLSDRGTRPGTWRCALTHAPFDHIDSRIVGVACGRGGPAGNLRKRPHAFLGTISASAPNPDAGDRRAQTRAPSTASSRPGKRAPTSSARRDT
jgi:hypothetical protein